MKKVYIKSLKGRTAEIISKLEEYGGINTHNLSADYVDNMCIFYINPSGTIDCTYINTPSTTALMWAGEEIKLDVSKFNIKDKVKIKTSTYIYTITDISITDDGTYYQLDNGDDYYAEDLLCHIDMPKEYDDVMVSNDGKKWFYRLYDKDCYVKGIVLEQGYETIYNNRKYKYIVPKKYFDFNNLRANIYRSII